MPNSSSQNSHGYKNLTPSGSSGSENLWGRQAKFWFLVAAGLALMLWLFSPILLPFVLGAVIAYLLNPIVDLAQKKGVSRVISTSVLLGGFILILISLFSIVLPLVSAEILKLLKNLPSYMDQLWVMTEPYRTILEKRISSEEITQFKKTLESSSGQLVSIGQNFLTGLVSSGQALVSFFSLLVIMPIVAFFMMIEWPRITSWVDSQLPRRHAKDARSILSNIDTKLSGFIRGQLLVATSLGVIYAIAMKIAGLNFGLVIGLSAGILSIIPLVGSTVGLVAGALVAWFQSYELSYVAVIAVIFIIGQMIEGNILTPKLIGDRVGLHPLWILFAIMAGGSLLGLVGVLVAVPVAAIISVLVSFLLEKYKQSDYYAAPAESGTEQIADTSDTPK